MAKRDLSIKVSNDVVDGLYRKARDAGATGGKITGAGGGGFMLLFVPPSQRDCVRESLKELIHVPFGFEFQGSQISFYDPPEEDYSDAEKDRADRDICPSREFDTIT